MPNQTERLRHEVMCYKRLQDCRIVPSLFDVAYQQDVCAMILERGDALADQLTDDHVTLFLEMYPEPGSLIRRMCHILSMLQMNSIIHGDIKPSNFIFSCEPGVGLLLIDFSGSWIVKGSSVPCCSDTEIIDDERPQITAVTKDYRAPELSDDFLPAGYSVDVYSAGKTLHRWLRQLYKDYREGKSPAIAVVRRMMHQDPDQRLDIMDYLRQERQGAPPDTDPYGNTSKLHGALSLSRREAEDDSHLHKRERSPSPSVASPLPKRQQVFFPAESKGMLSCSGCMLNLTPAQKILVDVLEGLAWQFPLESGG